MKLTKKLTYLRHATLTLAGGLLAVVMTTLTTACDGFIYDDEPECPQGFAVRFVYDYNMLKANAFMSQVHCLTVFVYDADGNYVTTVHETDRSKLSDEDWRMIIPLPEGKYTIVAYGGMDCDSTSFSFTNVPAPGTTRTDLGVRLNPSCLTHPRGTYLHPLFYGELPEPAEVGFNDADYRPVTVPMMKDTNNLRIILQNVDGTPVYADDYEFEITDDNTLFAWNNDLLPAPTIFYSPWAQGQLMGGYREDPDSQPALTVTYAELSTSRFVVSSKARLNVFRADKAAQPAARDIEMPAQRDTVITLPLITYLQWYKSDRYRTMPPQEFLDREDEYDMIFFLDSPDHWLNTKIVVNDWVVRINDITGF